MKVDFLDSPDKNGNQKTKDVKTPMAKITTFFSAILMVSQMLAQELKITEIMAYNTLTKADAFDNYDDWIEIFNQGTAPVDIAGYYLTDDYANLTKWRIPSGQAELTTIPAFGYVLLWADSEPQEGPLHLTFGLSKDGEELALVLPDGQTIADSLNFPQQYSDVSYGRNTNGDKGFFFTPTPGENNSASIRQIVAPPHFVEPPGVYSAPVSVTIAGAAPGDEIYYTLDSTPPAENAIRYTAPVQINETTVLRARVQRPDGAASFDVAAVYIIGTAHSLPVLSIITDPANLFDKATGIYAQYNKEGMAWERPVFTQFFDGGVSQFQLKSGIRIQGNSSVRMPKKSFRLFFRDGYGANRLEYPLFANSGVNSFKNLVLRAGYDEDITTPEGTLLRDPLITELWRRMAYLTSHSRFAVLYLNDTFWGIYDTRENINEHFIKDHTGYTDLDLIRYRWEDWGFWEVTFGDSTAWVDLIDFFTTGDFSSDTNFQEAARRIDINNYTDLHAFGHCMSYRSWYYGASAYKSKTPDSVWKWTIWDMDRALIEMDWNGFDFYDDETGLYWNNIFIRKLLDNDAYRNYFINRHCDLLNTIFLPGNVLPVLDSLVTVIEGEIPREAERWESSVDKWQTNVEYVRQFIKDRPDVVRQQMAEYFNLGSLFELTINTSGNGSVKVNTIEMKIFPWNGIYFSNTPVEVTALAAEGYRFAGWDDPALSGDNHIMLEPVADYELTALFTKKPENTIEVIAPDRGQSGGLVPLISRVHDSDKGRVNPHVTTTFTASVFTAGIDTNFKVKKGAGSAVLNFGETTGNFELVVGNDSVGTVAKTIKIDDDYPAVNYSGNLAASDTIWTADADRFITADLTIPENTRLTISAGTWVLLAEKISLSVAGEIVVNGTPDRPVVFISADANKAFGEIEFISSKSSFTYCFFVNGGGDSARGWGHTGRQSVLFPKENSDVGFANCFILNSPGKAFSAWDSQVAVNNCLTAFVFHGGEFERTYLNYRNSYVMNIPNDDGIFRDEDNDGFHINYVHPDIPAYSVIDSCYFITGKDDAIDQNHSRVLVTNCWLEGWMHEGVAASGSDTIKVFNTVVKNCEQGIECGWDGPNVFVDHCVVVDNDAGLRFGDSYFDDYFGHMTVTNSILYNNDDNIRNYLNTTQAPYPGGIEISYSMTNDPDYDASPGCITGVPEFDENYFLTPGSPGWNAGINGSPLGLVNSDSGVVSTPQDPAHENSPATFILQQNYPNPFNAETKVQYTLTDNAFVSLGLYNLTGQRIVEVIANSFRTKGSYVATINAANLPTGIYFYRIKVKFQNGGERFQARKMLLLR